MADENSRTLEQVYRSAVTGLYARLRSNYDYIYRKFGDEGLKLISDMSREYGLAVAQRARSKLPNNSLPSIADYILRIFETVAYDKHYQDSIQMGDERAVIRVDECPLRFERPEMCRAHTTMEKTVVEELNPVLTYMIGKSIPAGDNYCEHIIELK